MYDEETGEILTDSNLNHNSRFYLDPHLAAIFESEMHVQGESVTASRQRMDLPVPIRNFANGFIDAEDANQK